MVPIRIDGPAVEPVTAADLRAWLRLDDAGGTAEDALLAGLARAARLAVEGATRRAVGAGRFRLGLPGWPRLPVDVALGPLTGVDAAALVAPDGTRAALDPGLVRLDPGRADRLAFGAAPAEAEGRAVEVDLLAGEASAPEPLVQGIRLLAAHWFENRGDAFAGEAALPGPVLALLAPWRRLRL